MEYNTQVGIFETGEKDSQGGAYKDNRFLALRKRELNEYEVKDGVAIIGDRAFYDAKLKSVTLPNSLRTIGQSAFAGCKNLTDVALPEGLEVIKNTAFRDCESLAELALPSTLLEVGARAFGPGLKRLVILSENVTFSPDAFKQAKSLEEIHVPEAVIGKYTVLFLAMGITVPLTEIKAEQEQEEEAIVEESTGNTTAATNKIDECAHTFNSDVISLNQQEEEEAIDEEQKEEYAEPQDESAQCNCVKESQIVALLKYYVEGELYSKYVFVHDGNYCVDAENHGDISFADCDIREDEKWLNFDECYCLGISSDTPVSQCEQDIIDSFYGALKDEGEFEYLTDLDETHLEYQ